MNIEKVEFSVRAYHCLKHAGINTIEELIFLTEEDLNKIRNLGDIYKREVVMKVKELGLEFKK